MDALRIYDEKKRDGTLADIELTEDLLISEPGADAPAGVAISADDLGLANIEGIARRVRDVFTPLEDRPANVHLGALEKLAPALAAEGRERLAALLDGLPPLPHAGEGAPLFVVLYTDDELLVHCLGVVCRHEGIHLFSTNEEKDVDPVIEQCRAKGGAPVLVLDAPVADDQRFSPEALADLRRGARGRHPHLCAVQLTLRGAGARCVAADDGVAAVLARPRLEESPATFADDFAAFLIAFPERLGAHARDQRSWCLASVHASLAALRELQDPAAVALALVKAAARSCERALTLVVRGAELIPERGIGFAPGAGREPLSLAGPALKIPVGDSGPLAEAVETGRCRWAPTGDAAFEVLFDRVGEPAHPRALLVPLRVAGRTVSLTYADWGQREPARFDLDLLEIHAAQAGLALESLLYRKRAEKPPAASTTRQ